MFDSVRSIARTVFVVMLVAGFAALATSGPFESSVAAQNPQSTPTPPPLDSKILDIMRADQYRRAQWGLLEVDAASGKTLNSLQAEKFFVPGSTAKNFSVSAALDKLGFDYRFHTPVYALGQVENGTLEGNLVLVASGDLALGGRTKADGTINFADVDHAEAAAGLDAKLIPEDPLGGLYLLAHQIREAGITRISGNVIIDNSLFRRDPRFTAIPEPIIVNDNLIDVVINPRAAGAFAAATFRPVVEPYFLDVQARTVASGGATALKVQRFDDGRILVTGTIAADSPEVLQVLDAPKPADFGRSAFITALRREGIEVLASASAPNPDDLLPTSRNYQGSRKVAEYVSPPFSEYAKLILKVSHNMGANLTVCLMGVAAGSKDCEDGFQVMNTFLRKAGVDLDQVALGDGRGDDNANYVTPTASVQLLRYWLTRPEATQFRLMLPIMGVDGSLAIVCTMCPAKGKVFAKTGTVGRTDYLNLRIIQAQAYAGYIEKEPGKFSVYHIAMFPGISNNLDDLLKIYTDLGLISNLLFLEGLPK